MPKKPSRRLRLHRETLRVLSSEALAAVAGGAKPLPKSNAWSAGQQIYESVVC